MACAGKTALAGVMHTQGVIFVHNRMNPEAPRVDAVPVADHLARWRDGGRQDVAFVIGGADGIAPSLRARADASISFGQMVWPHMLVRVMLAEQLYRAAAILAGTPYHRA